ncbi:MAG TPA: hypothetical protein VI033_03540 [Candidatus Nitrosopolaris sp.]
MKLDVYTDKRLAVDTAETIAEARALIQILYNKIQNCPNCKKTINISGGLGSNQTTSRQQPTRTNRRIINVNTLHSE